MAKWKLEGEYSRSPSDMVKEFMSVTGQTPDPDLQLKLMSEEYVEVMVADEDSVEELKELADLVYVIYGFAEARGYDKIDQRRPTAHLVGWRDSTLDLRTYQGFGRAPTLVYEPDVGGMASAPPQNCHVTAAHLAAMADILQYRVGHPPARLYTSSSATHDAQ
jgi:predicted house-cleaning noncanonical NTP pyrophosphatase (MazG superfamily)